MITPTEWDELIEWVDVRFPDKPWHGEQAVAYYTDMRDRFDMSDVWTAVFAMNEKGQRFAPNGSQLIAATIEVARRSAVEDLYRKELPVESEAVSTWEHYTQRRFGERLSWVDAIARIHAGLTTCKTRSCDIHYPKVDA